MNRLALLLFLLDVLLLAGVVYVLADLGLAGHTSAWWGAGLGMAVLFWSVRRGVTAGPP